MKRSPAEIMILDADESSVEHFRRILEGAKLNVVSEKTLEGAIALALQHAPHLFLVDLTSLKGNAELFFKMIQQNTMLKRIPVLATGESLTEDQIKDAKKWGAVDVLRKPIDSRTVVQRTQKIVKDRPVLRHEFPSENRPKALVKIQARISMANEAGFLLEAPVKLATRAQIEILSALLDQLACSNAVFRRTSLVAKPIDSGQFLNEIAAVGLSPATLGRIRKMVRDWK